MKVQGSRSGKALGISELLASACSASATLDPVPGSIIDVDIICHCDTKAQPGSSSGKRTDHKNIPGS